MTDQSPNSDTDEPQYVHLEDATPYLNDAVLFKHNGTWHIPVAVWNEPESDTVVVFHRQAARGTSFEILETSDCDTIEMVLDVEDLEDIAPGYDINGFQSADAIIAEKRLDLPVRTIPDRHPFGKTPDNYLDIVINANFPVDVSDDVAVADFEAEVEQHLIGLLRKEYLGYPGDVAVELRNQNF